MSETIRTSVREAVEGVIATAEVDADTRREGHAAGERLGRALVAGAAAAAHAQTDRSAEHRAEAFRAMAGVGRSHRRLGRGRTAEDEKLGG